MNFYTVKTPPARLPVELDVFKNHVRVLSADEDGLMVDYLSAATDEAQQYLGRPLITQTILLTTNRWRVVIPLEMPPVQSVVSVSYWDEDGVEATVDPSSYFVDLSHSPPLIRFKSDFTFPTLEDERPDPITIEFVGGYGAEPLNVPAQIRQGILFLAAQYYGQREEVSTYGSVSEFPKNSIWCWDAYRFFTFPDTPR